MAVGQKEGGPEDPHYGGGEVRGGRSPACGEGLRAADLRPAPDLSGPEAHDPIADTVDMCRHITVSAFHSVEETDLVK